MGGGVGFGSGGDGFGIDVVDDINQCIKITWRSLKIGIEVVMVLGGRRTMTCGDSGSAACGGVVGGQSRRIGCNRGTRVNNQPCWLEVIVLPIILPHCVGGKNTDVVWSWGGHEGVVPFRAPICCF